MLEQHLIESAKTAFERAYAPYSGFRVGAALLTEEDEIFLGCNIENISYGLTNCAERSALFAAVSTGRRHFSKIAIFSKSRTPISPCGACRQVLAEFNEDLEIISVTYTGERYRAKLSELLPRPKAGIFGIMFYVELCHVRGSENL